MNSNESITVKSSSPKQSSDNRIRNTKYSIITFIFVFMIFKMQFQNSSSIFFFFIMVVQLASPEYQVTSVYSSVVPWAVIFTITVIREGLDNYFRYLRDMEINKSIYKIFKNKKFETVESQELKVGDIILVEKNQRVPADCLLLKSEDSTGEIFIRTDQLDGETDWKRRNTLPETQQCSIDSILDITVEIEKPSKDIYSFKGNLKFSNLKINGEENSLIFPKHSPIVGLKSKFSEEHNNFSEDNDKILKSNNIGESVKSLKNLEEVMVNSDKAEMKQNNEDFNIQPRWEMGVDLENTIWANTVLSSSSALCLVIYTGHDTRSMMNTLQPRNKTGIIDHELNRFITIMAFISCACSIIFTYEKLGVQFNHITSVVMFRFVVIFSYVIPISLKFMMTTARICFVYLLSKDPKLNTVKVLTNTLQEELARISFFLTDKTGTLTKNEMLMKKLHIGTICYNAENIEEIKTSVKKVLGRSVNPLKKNFWKKPKSIDSKIYELIEALSICHNVNPIESETGFGYQASSPDEIAMVNYSMEIGLTLIKRDTLKMVIKDSKDVENVYKILYTFPFNSDTKRMGIIVQKDDEYIFFEKGADTVMKSIIKENDWIEEETDNMAREGLRTLVFAKKVISSSEFDAFRSAYEQAKSSLMDRNEKMLTEQKKLENNMEIVGLTGVEDRLQDNVKQTLESIRNAGIKIWMLTGDKIETAISIAFSSRLLTRSDQYLIISNCKSKEEIENNLNLLSSRGYNCLVIDGTSLELIIENYLARFIDIAKNLSCLVGCRYSPTQKSIMASSLRLRAKETVLCIGDGGNDVSMITSADVGVGIEGKEGSQASLAADFSLKNFSDVAELMFHHGRKCYQNTSKIAHIIFHRGIILSTIQGIFCILICFYPVSIFQGNVAALFILFTILPLFFIIFDRDIPKAIAMKYPELYRELRENDLLSIRQFFITLTISVYQGLAFIMMLFYFNLESTEMFSMSISCFTNLILNEQFMVCLSVWESLNYRLFLACLGSVFAFIVWSLITDDDFSTIVNSLKILSNLLFMNFIAIIPKTALTFYKLYINPPSYIKIQKQHY